MIFLGAGRCLTFYLLIIDDCDNFDVSNINFQITQDEENDAKLRLRYYWQWP